MLTRLRGNLSTLPDRFWAKVAVVHDEDSCWDWTARKTTTGYGEIDKVGAHRVSYYLATGEDPGDRDVLHRCDRPSCVRPSHLFLGYHEDNMADAARKGRMPGRRVLTDEQVAELRRLAAEGATSVDLAPKFGISAEQAGRLAAGVSRKDPSAPLADWRAKGLIHSRVKLTDEDVAALRAQATAGARVVDLARQYDVSCAHVSSILAGEERAGRRRPRAAEQTRPGRYPLPAERVRLIRRLLAAGRTQAWIARDLGVNPATVSRIASGLAYKEVS